MRPRLRLLRQLIAGIEIDLQRMREREASGWVVVVIDDESRTHVHTVGPYPTPESALIAAGKMAEEDRRTSVPGEPLWTHVILPLYAPDEWAHGTA